MDTHATTNKQAPSIKQARRAIARNVREAHHRGVSLDGLSLRAAEIELELTNERIKAYNRAMRDAALN